MPEIGEQPVADIHQRTRARPCQGWPGRIRWRRTAVGGHQRPVPHTGEQQVEAGRRAAHRAGEHDRFPRPRSGPRQRGTPRQIAQRGHRQADLARADHVTADDGRADQRTLVAQTVGHAVDDLYGRGRRAGQADQQGGGRGSHGRHIREALRGGLAPHVVRRGPVETEVAPLDQQVCGSNHITRRCGDHCSVVTGTRGWPR